MRDAVNAAHILLATILIISMAACSGGTSMPFTATPTATAFDTCDGSIALNTATSTDINPPTWTWSRCNVANPQFRVSLDDPNTAATVTTATLFTPTTKLYVGRHTLFVSQQLGDGSWTATTSLSITLLARAQLGSVSVADPNVDPGYGTLYQYPYFDFNTVEPTRLEVSAASGFDPHDVIQSQQLADCYFVASMAAVANANPTYLNKMVMPMTDDYGNPVVDANNYPLYRIKLFYPDADGNPVTWTMITDAQFPYSPMYGGYIAHYVADGNMVKIGYPLLEKGFAALDQSKSALHAIDANFAADPASGYKQIGQGGLIADGFAVLLGTAGHGYWTLGTLTRDTFVGIGSSPNTAAAGCINSYTVIPPTVLPSGATMTLQGNSFVYQPANGSASISLEDAHCYTLMSVDTNGLSTWRNPWGPGSEDAKGLFTMPYEDVVPTFQSFNYATAN